MLSKLARWARSSLPRIERPAVFLIVLSPFLLLLQGVLANTLGPDPAEYLMTVTGEWALRILILVLLARPMAQWGWPVLFRFRRMLGLFVYFYACVHLLVFGQVYVGWSIGILAEELTERPYVVVGFMAWLLLLPLAITSASALRRRMGRRWRQLHTLVYPIALLAWFHIFWLSRSDVGEALVYGAVFGALLGWRATKYLTKRLR